MIRQRVQPAKSERKFEFLQAIIECQIGNPKIDFAKLADRLGYKNERCASDSYYRFCREHLGRGQGGKKSDVKPKQQYHANGKVIAGKAGGMNVTNRDDDDEDHDDIDDDDDDDDYNEDRRVVMKAEDFDMGGCPGAVWGSGIINLVEPDEWGHPDDVKVKPEPEVKKEQVPEVWIW